MITQLKTAWRRALFLPPWWAVFINPSYIIRRGIFVSLREIAPTVEGRILDLGCGSKPYRSLFTSCETYIGVDIAVSGHDHSDSVVDVYYDGKTIPFDDNSFDSVVCFEVFEHIFNIDEVIREIFRVIRPEGKLVLSIPFAWPEHEQPYDFARYTSFGIADILSRHGFQVETMRKTTNSFEAICQLYIEYIINQVLPNRGGIAKILRLPVISLMNIFSVAFNLVMPRRQDLFSGLIVVAKASPDDIAKP